MTVKELLDIINEKELKIKNEIKKIFKKIKI